MLGLAGLVVSAIYLIFIGWGCEGTDAGDPPPDGSLGATLFAAVEGMSPFGRTTAIATLAALAADPVPPAKKAGPLRPVIEGLLRKDPATRPDTAACSNPPAR